MNIDIMARLTAPVVRVYSRAQLDAAFASRCTFEWRPCATADWMPRTDYLRVLAGVIESGGPAQLRAIYPVQAAHDRYMAATAVLRDEE